MNDDIKQFYKKYNIHYDNTQPHRAYIDQSQFACANVTYANIHGNIPYANISVNSSTTTQSIVTIRHEITIDRPDYIRLINDTIEHNELMEYMLSSETGVKFLEQFRILKTLRS